MVSAINATRPTDTAFYAGDLRSNLSIAKSEITALQDTIAFQMTALSQDPSPDLGANLNVSGYKITTLQSNGSVVLEPNGTGALQLNGAIVEVGRQIRHIGDTDTWIIFDDAGSDIAFGTLNISRLSVNDLGVKFGTGARVSIIYDQDDMASNSATALATQQSIKAYVDANAGINALSADPSPDLSGTLNGNAHSIVNYTQPKVSSVSGALTQASHGGRPCHITDDVTVPNADGFVCELRNKSGSVKTITPAGGNLIHEGATKPSISLPNLRAVVVAGDGTDVWVYGALA